MEWKMERRVGPALLLAASLFPFAVSPASAGAAKAGFRFLERAPGARQAAMGDTAVAMPDDANATLWNPAGLADARQAELALGYAKFLTEMGGGGLTYVHPLNLGAFSVSAFSQGSGDIPGYDASDAKTSSFEVKDSLFSAGWGRPVGEALRLGVNVKRVSQEVGSYSAGVTAFDLGAVMSVPAPQGWAASLSGAVRNAGGKASFAQEETPLPGAVDAGLSVRGFSDALRLALELHSPSAGDTRLRAGGELWIHNSLAARAGFKTGQGLGGGVSMGVGFRVKTLQIDYSYAPSGDGFGATHHAGIILRFGRPAEKAYQEGLSLAQRGDYAEAILKFQTALDADPRHAGAMRGLRDATRGLEALMGEELNKSRGKR